MQVSKVLVVDGDRAARDALVIDGAHTDIVVHNAEGSEATASILVLTRGGIPAAHANYPIVDTLRRPVALSRVVERVESLIHERTLRNGVALRFGGLSLDAVNQRASFGELATS
jgi:hypothetical protein